MAHRRSLEQAAWLDDPACAHSYSPLFSAQVVHGDYQHADLFFDGDDVSGVIDWDAASAMCRGFEIVRACSLMFQLEPDKLVAVRRRRRDRQRSVASRRLFTRRGSIGFRTVADMTMIELAEIDDDNLAAVQAVTVSDRQRDFVGTVQEALDEAADCPEGNPWYRAVVVDGTVVGFVMLSWNVTPDPPEIIGPWFLWKLIVDQQHQGRGIGAAVVQAVAAIVRAEGATELLTSFVPAEDGPAGFYARLGFVPTGDVDVEGETIVGLDL